MRLIAACLMILTLPLLAACDSSAPPAKAPVSAPKVDAKTPAAKLPAVKTSAKLPAGAQPLLGSFAADLANCGNKQSVTVITATSYSVGDKSCDMTLAANKDGSFIATCGGDKISMMPIFAPTGEGINLKLGDKKATVLRCTK